MSTYIKYLLIFLAGIFLTYFFVSQTKDNNKSEASHTIAYAIQRLNKMVVAEQTYANFYSHKSQNTYLGDLLSFDKNVLLKVEVKAQASYNLNELVVDIDSANQVIHIKRIPEVKVETYPDIEFFDMKQSTLNQFTNEDLNGIKKRAIEEVIKTINLSNLKVEAREQLIYNLEEIYLLAKIYGWEVQDDTPYAQELENKIKL
ncbi:DUF4230 domain-containing protein [Flavobacteriaceae bacterium Ap0902]|nr:DUF4230 domain-containing protein [Flavobacteriaceae bacterium Ap0902]